MAQPDGRGDLDLLRLDAVGQDGEQLIERVEMVPVRVFADELAADLLSERHGLAVLPDVVAR